MDFSHAYMLMLLIKEASLHGTVYKKVSDAAAAELRDMIAAEEPKSDLFESAPKGYMEQQIEEGRGRGRKEFNPEASESVVGRKV